MRLLLPALPVSILLLTAGPATSQLSGGAHAVPLVTYVSPILHGRDSVEVYLSQPTLLGDATLMGGVLRLHGAVSLEALTLKRGEMGAGAYGEGYVDRRHPHTFLHELVATVAGDVGPAALSATAGRGFVAFGTDDPMMRPFVKFPVNHHLAQILERLVLVGGIRGGLRDVVPGGVLMLEATVFNGNEPLDERDIGSLARFGDSWAARLTMFPAAGLEVQGSYAWVASPEMPAGGGHDHRKWSASLRYDGALFAGGSRRFYALAEWKRTTEVDWSVDIYSFGSVLAEAAVDVGGWRPAVRLERSERPEEQRQFDPFRSAWPNMGAHGLGLTQWTIAAARIERRMSLGGLHVAPFAEASTSHVRETAGGAFQPEIFYGSNRITTLNAGARLQFGAHRPRMGRYGVAAGAAGASAAQPHHH
jgi:hypothetical protein